ncbi:hypothetical protein HK101_010581 [Irineochytrium annulatum]|nr:hypothetical protein HK101_010581 [Irineochytrium annulatum]
MQEQQPKKKIRSSIDLELRLPFENSPLDKPSNAFSRDATAWFRKGPEDDVIAVPKPAFGGAPISPDSTSQYDPETLERGVRKESLGRGRRNNNNGNTNSMFRNSFNFFYRSNNRDNQPSTLGRGNGRPEDYDDDDGAYNGVPTSKRPVGPRAMGEAPTLYRSHHNSDGQSPYGTLRPLNAGNPNSNTRPVHIRMPPLSHQPRLWCCLALVVLSATAAAVMGSLVARFPRANASAVASYNFFLVSCGASFIVGIASLVLYIVFGRNLFGYYDAPFLFCQDIPLDGGGGGGGGGGGSAAMSELGSEDSAASGSGDGGKGRRLLKRNPSPWVPLLDVGVQFVLIVFWAATLADFGVIIPGCVGRAKGSADTGACTSEIVAATFGGLAALVVVGMAVMKGIELFKSGVMKAIVLRRY